VQWRITGGAGAVLFISGFSEAVREQYALGQGSARGLRVASVEYLVDGEVLAALPGDPSHKWTGERFAARHAFDKRGSYRCEVRVKLQAPGEVEGLATVVELEGEPLVVVIKDAHDQRLLEYPGHSANNLLRTARVTLSASTQNGAGQEPVKAADGRLGTTWMSTKNDPSPKLVLELGRPQRGRVLLITQANINEFSRNAHDRATRVRVVLNGKETLTFDLEVPAEDERKCVLELEKALTLRRVEITILERATGTKWPGFVGICEVEWLK